MFSFKDKSPYKVILDNTMMEILIIKILIILITSKSRDHIGTKRVALARLWFHRGLVQVAEHQ